MSRPNIERFLELAEKATKGPWKAGNVENTIFDAENTEVCFVNIRGGSMYGRRNIPFIINARNEAPDIARYALLLEKALGVAVEGLEEIQDYALEYQDLNTDMKDIATMTKHVLQTLTKAKEGEV